MWAYAWVEYGKLRGIRVIGFVEESVIRNIPCMIKNERRNTNLRLDTHITNRTLE
jgi:hypothetical protein